MAPVLGLCTWPLNFFLEGEFTLATFGLGFPLDVLAAAAVTVYGYTPTDTMQVKHRRASRLPCDSKAVPALLLIPLERVSACSWCCSHDRPLRGGCAQGSNLCLALCLVWIVLIGFRPGKTLIRLVLLHNVLSNYADKN